MLRARVRAGASPSFQGPGRMVPRFHREPKVVLVPLKLERDMRRRFRSSSARNSTLFALTSPLFVILKWYLTSESAVIVWGASIVVATARSGLCPPKEMSPLQSPKMLNCPNIQFLPTMLVLTMLMTLAAAYASPVSMCPTPSSVSVTFCPVTAHTFTSVVTIALLVEDARKSEELYLPAPPAPEPPPVEIISMSQLLPSGACVARHDIPAGSPCTLPLHAPHKRKERRTEEPPTRVWLARVMLLDEEYALPVCIAPEPKAEPVVVATFSPVIALAVVVPKKSSSLSLSTTYELEFISGSELPLARSCWKKPAPGKTMSSFKSPKLFIESTR